MERINMINKMCIISFIIISFFYNSPLLADDGDCKRGCNNTFKECMTSQNMFNTSLGFVQHKFNVFNDKELLGYMKLPEMSKIDSKKIVYSKKEAYLEIMYSINDSEKKYEKKTSWYELCKADYQSCINKC